MSRKDQSFDDLLPLEQPRHHTLWPGLTSFSMDEVIDQLRQQPEAEAATAAATPSAASSSETRHPQISPLASEVGENDG